MGPEYNGHKITPATFPTLLALIQLNQCYNKVGRSTEAVVRHLWSGMEVIMSMKGSSRYGKVALALESEDLTSES